MSWQIFGKIILIALFIASLGMLLNLPLPIQALLSLGAGMVLAVREEP